LKSLLDKKLITNYLTIRYNPLEKTEIRPLRWRDLRPKFSDPSGNKTEKILINSIYNSVLEKKKTIVVSLSSGIDSTLSLALLRKAFPNKKIVAICAVFQEGYDESRKAKLIAEKFGADCKVLHMESIFATMPELIYISKKPRWNSYQHLIAKEAKKYGDILVTGDGADELFGGYTFRYNKFLYLLTDRERWKTKVINYLECHNRDWVPDQPHLFGSTIKFEWEKIYQYFREYFRNPLEPLTQVMLADFNGKLLHDFIPTGKAIYNHYKVDGISFYLDNDLINFAMHLPLRQKYDIKNKKGKLILRKIAKRLKVEHIEEKRGFSPSLLFDWKKYGKPICESYLLDKKSHIFQKRLINYNWVIRSFEKVDNDLDIRYLNRMITILALEIWFRLFITKEIKPNKKLI